MRIPDEKAALALFCLAANAHAEAAETGNYRASKKAHQQLIAALRWLEDNQATHLLGPLLTAAEIGARLWAASYLLHQRYALAEETLNTLATRPDIHGFGAAMTLREWRAGRLKPLT